MIKKNILSLFEGKMQILVSLILLSIVSCGQHEKNTRNNTNNQESSKKQLTESPQNQTFSLRGKAFRYTKTQQGISTREFVYFCSNGSYLRQIIILHSSVTGSYNSKHSYSGTWNLQGHNLHLTDSESGNVLNFPIEVNKGNLHITSRIYSPIQNDKCN